jgi:hypothetical protein
MMGGSWIPPDTQPAIEERTMPNKFVVTKKAVVRVIDGSGPQCANMSVVPDKMGGVYLVIGAKYDDRCAAAFRKDSIKELIDILSEILEALED